MDPHGIKLLRSAMLLKWIMKKVMEEHDSKPCNGIRNHHTTNVFNQNKKMNMNLATVPLHKLSFTELFP